MPNPVNPFRWMTVCSVALLAACGGSGGGIGAPIGSVVPPAPATVLTVSVANLALAAPNPAALPTAIPGNPRVITVANTGSQPALTMTVDSSLLPALTTVTANTCTGTLAALASCSFTITPGTNATTLPVTVTVKGSNTNTVSTAVNVLKYGSTYQNGIVFALDDTTANTGSVGGKATAQTEAAAGPWSPTDLQATAAGSLTDGAANTVAILATYSDPLVYPSTAVAARACNEFSGGASGWYLPAICELGYDQTGAGTGCGSAASPLVQNVQSSLVDNSVVPGAPGTFWSSTDVSPTTSAWAHHLEGGNTFQVATNKAVPERLLCVRQLN